MLEVHHALLDLAAVSLLVASGLAVRTLLTGAGRRTWIFAGIGFLALLADALGRTPVVLRAGESEGTLSSAALDVGLRGVLPILLWSLVLLGRWRSWLADVIFAWSVLIAAALTLAVWLLPL